MTGIEPKHRRSRFGWPTQTEPTTTPAGTHSHKQSNGPLLLAFLCIVLLFFANVGLIWFILVRGAARDAAEERVQRQIRDSWCQALDGFPQDSVFLDPLRERYDCGPGKPIEDLTPAQREHIARHAPAVRPVEPSAAASPTAVPTTPPLGSGAVPNAPRRTENPVPPRPEPTPSPTPSPPPPLVDLGPITDPVCNLAGICL